MIDPFAVRMRAIQFVLGLRERWTGIPAAELRKFHIDGDRIPLTSIQGIFKPAVLTEPLSIRSALDSPYADPIDGSHVRYSFAPPSREYENDGLKQCASKHLPLIYFVQTKPKPNTEYIVFAPVFVTNWDNASREFLIDLSEQTAATADHVPASAFEIADAPPLDKRYVPTIVERRLHQARFRNQVLAAYRERCAVCVLRVRPLLDGAHLLPDRDPKPTIVVNEGMALCAIHHRALDARILRYDAAYRIGIDLPAGAVVGEGERSMLLAYDGRPLSLPANVDHHPLILSM